MATKKLPAWAAARARARGELVAVGQVWTPSDVVALIDRVNARYRALALAVAQTSAVGPQGDPLGLEWRNAWASHYRAWLDFAEAGRGVWGSAWGSTATTAQDFDLELDAFRQEFEERTGTDLGIPDSQTAPPRGGGWGDWFSGVGTGAGLALVGGIVALIAISRVK